eukprot:9104673-Pyramimonas_sp.AAC.1
MFGAGDDDFGAPDALRGRRHPGRVGGAAGAGEADGDPRGADPHGPGRVPRGRPHVHGHARHARHRGGQLLHRQGRPPVRGRKLPPRLVPAP